ncbi:MAG: glycosyltransferase family 39 protein [Chloroflexia bacterium]|nr:glycosyltransferase family 39 protein [Chloroflexia bacterium]
MKNGNRHWLQEWILPALLMLLALGAGFLYLQHLQQVTDLGVSFDDAWIHFTLARNLAETGEMGLNPGRWSGGNSSLLWGLLLTLGYRLGGSPLIPALALGAISHTLASGLFYELNRRLWGPAGGLLCGLLYAGFGPLLALSLSGMETALFLMLGLAVLWAWSGPHAGRAPGLLITGGLLFLLLLTRLEGLLLWGLLLLHFVFWGRRTMRPRAALAALLAGPLAFLLTGLLHLRMEGSFLPLTMTGRRWLWQVQPSKIPFWPTNWQPIRDYYGIWNVYFWDWLLQRFRLEGQGALRPVYQVLWLLLLLAGATWVVRTAWRGRGERQRWVGLLLLLWALAHWLLYPLALPLATLRHQALLLPALLLLAGAGLEALRALGRRWHRLPFLGWALWALGLAGLLLWGGLIWGQWRSNHALQVRHINEMHVSMGRWVNDHLPPDAVVAAFDIGAISYFGGREILDLGGLCDPELLPYLYQGDVRPYLYEQGVTHLAMITGPSGDHWWGRLGLEARWQVLAVRELRTWEVAPYARPPFDRPADYYFYPASLSMGLYELSWPRVPVEARPISWQSGGR